MPYIEVSTEVDYEVDEFINECSKREISEMIDILIEQGHLKRDCKSNGKPDQYSLGEETHREYCDVFSNSYHRLSGEEEETIMNIAKKYS
jgi:hypothetical protein